MDPKFFGSKSYFNETGPRMVVRIIQGWWNKGYVRAIIRLQEERIQHVILVVVIRVLFESERFQGLKVVEDGSVHGGLNVVSGVMGGDEE